MAHIIFGTLGALNCRDSMLSVDYVFNFNTMVSNVPMLTALNPFYGSNCQINTCDPSFDAWYSSYLSNDPNAFKEFINLMRLAYNGANVWLLSDFSMEPTENVIESLIGFINNTYGFACNICKEPEDTYINGESEFSPQGIQFFDAHLSNYLQYFGENGLESDTE